MSSSQARRGPEPGAGQHLLEALALVARRRRGPSQPLSPITEARGLQVPLEVARHVGAGQEVLHRGELGERVQPEALEEEVCRAEKRRLAGAFGVADHGDVAALFEQAGHPVDVDPRRAEIWPRETGWR